MPERLIGLDAENYARQAIETAGYSVESIALILAGQSHYDFSLSLNNNWPAIARFEKPHAIGTPDGIRRDYNFNGPLSLERERNLLELVREAGLPAPEVYGLYSNEHGKFLLVEKLTGNHWSEYVEANGYSLEAYLRSLEYLGQDIALAHRVKFESFGDVIGRSDINPGNISDFTSRVALIAQLIMQRAAYSQAFEQKELEELTQHFQNQLDTLSQKMRAVRQQPILVLTDLHPMNFFVGERGKPSGYFDLEFCQSALPALEFCDLRLSLFNYFEGSAEQAEQTFLKGYEHNGGSYDPSEPVSKQLEYILAIGHVLYAVIAYHNVHDGLRDTWSDKCKQILFEAQKSGEFNYKAYADVFRVKTKQPKFASP